METSKEALAAAELNGSNGGGGSVEQTLKALRRTSIMSHHNIMTNIRDIVQDTTTFWYLACTGIRERCNIVLDVIFAERRLAG